MESCRLAFLTFVRYPYMTLAGGDEHVMHGAVHGYAPALNWARFLFMSELFSSTLMVSVVLALFLLGINCSPPGTIHP